MAKLRGTEAEIYARLRELTEEFRQLRRELADNTQSRVTGRTILARAEDRPRPPRTSKERQPKDQ